MAEVWRSVFVAALLICASMLDPAEAVGGAKSRPRPQRRPPKKPKVEPTDAPPLAQNVDLQRMMGTWFLLITASKCSYLINHGTKVEPTVMTLARSSDHTLSVSTKTRHNHQCWEILQVYNILPTPGRLMLKGTRAELNTDIMDRGDRLQLRHHVLPEAWQDHHEALWTLGRQPARAYADQV
ncbi:unnamed protein product [Tetraodon nigroviridis]|uniref:(spotted green pufferfish) hypothetical protein n=1 Tax=Tetraodon nigroviridis TaxID=99883 RepID=Q4SN20_TETNG|nr:unnamed protein product [Tetraodon nigroviridis]